MVAYGVNPYEPNPGIDGTGSGIASERSHRYSNRHNRSRMDDTHEEQAEEDQVYDDYDDEEEDYTSIDSAPSDHSSVAPSFFIIPPRETTAASVRQRQKQHQRLGDNTVVRDNDDQEENGDSNNTNMVSPCNSLESNYVGCRPYRRDKIVTAIDTANGRGGGGHADVLKALKNAGVLIFIVDSKVTSTIPAIMDSIKNVIYHTCQVQRDASSRNRELGLLDPANNNKTDPCCTVLCGEQPNPEQKIICTVHSQQNQRCILYRDPEGRLFNLTLASHTTAQAKKWEDSIQSFSVVQAVCIFVLLLRAYPCATKEGTSCVLITNMMKSTMLGVSCGVLTHQCVGVFIYPIDTASLLYLITLSTFLFIPLTLLLFYISLLSPLLVLLCGLNTFY
jgi:hypothetical protein